MFRFFGGFGSLEAGVLKKFGGGRVGFLVSNRAEIQAATVCTV